MDSYNETDTSSREPLEAQISAMMDALVEAAVTELGRLLEESEPTPPEDRRPFNKRITDQFASLMEAWAKGAADKISLMLKVSMCAADGEQRVELSDASLKAGQTSSPGKKSAVRISRRRRKRIQVGFQPMMRKKEHVYRRALVLVSADAASHEGSNSGPPSEPEASSTEPTASDVGEKEVAREDADPSSETAKRKTTGPFKCPSCDKMFSLKCLMDRHRLTHSKPHLCSECGKRFSGLRGLVAHSRRHTGEKLYECSDCGTRFAYRHTFHRHVRRHGLNQQSAQTCTLCEKQFAGVRALQRHRCCALKTTFVCSLCPETFKCRPSLADHENLHSGDRDFVCEMCGDTFFSSSSLSTHRVTHAQKETRLAAPGAGSGDASVPRSHPSKGGGEKLFTCEVCGKGCSHRSALKHHMLTHTGDRPFVCETCGKRCGHASALQNHARVHSGRKPGERPLCDVCGKTFRCAVNLKYHTSVHTGEKPYGCDRCGKTFSNPSNLKLHAATHSGEKSHGCSVCGKRFGRAAGLRLHRRVHTGERPYRCAACGKEFIYSRDFKKHQRDHLPEGDGDAPSGERAGTI
ncbi:oocyte zinc finger protein XlCOF6-like [Brachyistius frenatus]|uniref:oocyte zinc finger protein XlCOF6-like n=1 Tax=Brachyistius frenatus TaxID=100188 RepID=UPI0037E7384B